MVIGVTYIWSWWNTSATLLPLVIANTYTAHCCEQDMLLLCNIAHMITRSRSIQVKLGVVEDFLKLCCTAKANANKLFEG